MMYVSRASSRVYIHVCGISLALSLDPSCLVQCLTLRVCSGSVTVATEATAGSTITQLSARELQCLHWVQWWGTLRWLGRVIHCKFPLHPLPLPISILHISIAHFHSAYTIATNCACAVRDS